MDRPVSAIAVRHTGPHAPSELRGYLDDVLSAVATLTEPPGRMVVCPGGRSFELDAFPSSLVEGDALRALPRDGEVGSPPRFRVVVWDVATAGGTLPRPAPPRGAARPEGRARVLAHQDRSTGTMTLVDLDRRVGVVVFDDEAARPSWARSAPLLPLLHWSLADEGIQLVHAGAVADGDAAVVVVGPGGAGKSTTCLAAVDGGFAYLGDDYVAIEPTASGPVVHRVFGSAKVDAVSERSIGGLGAWTTPLGPRAEGEKLALCVEVERQVARAPVGAVVVPRLGGDPGAPAVPTRVPAREALLRVAPSTLLQLDGAGPGALQALTGAVRAVPCYEVHLPPDPRAVPAVLCSLLPRS